MERTMTNDSFGYPLMENMRDNQELLPKLVKSEKKKEQVQGYKTWCKSREWYSKKNMKKFFRSLDGLVMAVDNGFDRQGKIYIEECWDIIDADRTDRIMGIARGQGLWKVKLFMVANPEGKKIKVEGKKNDWNVIPVNDFKKRIPVQVLKNLEKLREQGIKFDGFGVAEVAARRAVKIKDPILLGRVGKFWVELGRWE